MVIDPSKYITGIPLIDKQHKQFLALVNKLVDSSHKGDMTKAEFCDCVNQVVTYAFEHFDAEEFLMRSANYPLYEEHLAKHDVFRDQMDELLEEIDSKEIDINHYVKVLCKWLVDWFKMQVLYDDMSQPDLLKKTISPRLNLQHGENK